MIPGFNPLANKGGKSKMGKYERMKKLGMPMESIVNRMRMDGIPADKIQEFTGLNPDGSDPNAPGPDAPMIDIPQTQVKLKPFHWGKILSRQIRDTVWEDIQRDAARYVPNYDEIQLLFEKVEITRQTSSSPTPAKETQSVIDPRRSQNVMIGLSTMGLAEEELRDAILRLDNEKLPPDKVQKLIPYLPTDTELDMIRDYVQNGGDVTELDRAERFFVTLMDLVAVQQRLNLWLFTNQFPSIIANVRERIETVRAAITALRESERLRVVFTIILNIGNYLNQGSAARGNAWGFRLEPTLDLLDGMKANDKKTSLIMFVVKSIQDIAPDAANFVEDISPVSRAMRVESGGLQKDLDDIKRDMETIAKKVQAHRRTMTKTHTAWAMNGAVSLAAVAKHMRNSSRMPQAVQVAELQKYDTLRRPPTAEEAKDDTPEDMFFKMMLQFHKRSNAQFREVCNDFSITEREASDIAVQFGCEEDIRWEQLFKIFDKFRLGFTKAQRELQASAKKRQRQQQKQALKSQVETQLRNRPPPPAEASDEADASGAPHSREQAKVMEMYQRHQAQKAAGAPQDAATESAGDASAKRNVRFMEL